MGRLGRPAAALHIVRSAAVNLTEINTTQPKGNILQNAIVSQRERGHTPMILRSWKLISRTATAVAIGGGLAIVVGSAMAQTPRVPTIVTVCAPCHGVKGDGGDVEKPNLAGQKSIYIRLQLLAFRSGKRKHPQMQSIVRNLNDREIDQLVVYYSTLVP